MHKRFLHNYLLLIIIGGLLLYIVQYYYHNHQRYMDLLKTKTNKIIEGASAPRGKIYDVNGNVLVDNKIINNLVFYNLKGTDKKQVEEKLSKLFTFEDPTEKEMILYYKDNHNTEKLLSNKEKRLIKERKINSEEKEKIINKRVKKLIKNLSSEDRKLAKIHSLLNKGYDYEAKLIIKNISDEDIKKVLLNNIDGLKIESSFERYYPYEETLKTILGSTGKITKENAQEYLDSGFELDDIIGVSYLEKYYDNYLQGTKAKYLVNNDNSLTLLEKEKKGSDLYLSIDINLQMEVDRIVKENISKAKNFPNTNFLNDSYVIISNPKNGEIKAISGWRMLDNNHFNDITTNSISSSFTMGSVVKGATISVGYENGLINPYEKIYDSCVKLKNINAKCSWKDLGYLDAITALEQSSNYYQFLIAIKLAGQTYYPNMDLKISKKEFDIYRNMLKSYGLGVKTGIDLPNEKIGLIGDKISSDLLLNLAIGQYDTYTPIELLTYINTIADKGQRRKPNLVQKIVNNNQIIYENKNEIVDQVGITSEDNKKIQEGFYYVMNRGTGLGFMNKDLSPAGKTGTSESFLDTNNDGIVDTPSLTLTLAGYFPYEDPKMSIVIVSPNASYRNNSYDYIYYITANIARDITNLEQIKKA